jgi:hypothetical protein
MLRLLSLALSISLFTALQAAPASEQVQQALQLEQSGRVVEARIALARAAHGSSSDTDTLLANAEFLERYEDDEAEEGGDLVLHLWASMSWRAFRAASASPLAFTTAFL